MNCPKTGYECIQCTVACPFDAAPALPPHQLGWCCPTCNAGIAPWQAICPRCAPPIYHTVTLQAR